MSMPFRKQTKYALRGAPNPDEVSVLVENEEERCCICLEPIEESKSVTLRCCHKFHGQCLCDHLVHDSRCPICRDSPYNAPSSDDDEDDPEAGPYVSYSEALKKGREAAKTDKGTARMMKTIKKWKKERATAKREMKESQKKIQPLETAMNQKIDEFIEKENAKFKKKHAKLLKENEELRKKRTNANTLLHSARMRMAIKHGFVRCIWRRSRRSRRSHW
jgi:DNA repair exonuclease SbcCD ATPase subunit